MGSTALKLDRFKDVWDIIVKQMKKLLNSILVELNLQIGLF